MTTTEDNRIVQPYLFFNGNCEEAVEFYRKALGAEVEMTMRYINLSAEDVRAEFERAARRIARGSPDDKSLPESP